MLPLPPPPTKFRPRPKRAWLLPTTFFRRLRWPPSTSLLNRPSRSIAVPTTPPMARLAMNRTG